MPELIRLSIADSISRRYARSALLVYGAAAVCFALFVALMTAMNPSFLVYTASALLFILGVTVCIMRNPLSILTLRVQKKLAAREFIFTPDELTIVRHSGHALSFKCPEVELLFLDGTSGCDYYLLVKADESVTGSCYVGNDQDEIERLADLLAQRGALAKYEKPQTTLDK